MSKRRKPNERKSNRNHHFCVPRVITTTPKGHTIWIDDQADLPPLVEMPLSQRVDIQDSDILDVRSEVKELKDYILDIKIKDMKKSEKTKNKLILLQSFCVGILLALIPLALYMHFNVFYELFTL